MGTLLPEDIKTIYVPTFKNSTGEPNLEVRATNAVIDKLNIDGTLRVVSNREDADSILEATIVEYKRKPVRYSGSSDPTEYRLTITVNAGFTNLLAGEAFWKDQLISGEAEFVVRGGLPSSERAALPTAFDDLAHDIVETIVEGWQ
jgi:hypothetical protein